MKFLKGLGYFFAVLILLALLFVIVTMLTARINEISFYEQLKLWFGPGTYFEKLLTKI